jgi:hypothetical protein
MKQAFTPLLYLVIVCIAIGSALPAASERYFQVEMLAPGYFRIQPNNPGPISTVLVGGPVPINHSRKMASIYADVQLGALLKIKVGSHQLLYG